MDFLLTFPDGLGTDVGREWMSKTHLNLLVLTLLRSGRHKFAGWCSTLYEDSFQRESYVFIFYAPYV